MSSGLIQSGIEYLIKDSTARGTAGVLGSLNKIEKQVKGVQSMLKTGLTIGLGVLGVRSVVSEIQEVAKGIDDAAKASDRLGISTQAYTSLQYAASLAGVGVDQLRLGIEQMTRKVSEAAQGTGEARKEIAELGLSAADLARANPEQMLYDFADAMAAVENPADRVRIAIKLFGESGVRMINVLQAGSQALKDTQVEADRLGITFDRIDAAQVEKARDAWARMSQIIKAIEIRAVIEMAPYVEAIATSLVEATTAGGGFGETVTEAMRSVALAAAKVLEVMEKASGVGRTLEGGGYTLGFERAVKESARARYELEIEKTGREPYVTRYYGPYGGPAVERIKYQEVYDAIEKQVRERMVPYFDASKANLNTDYVGQVEQFFRNIEQRIAETQQEALIDRQRAMYGGTTVELPPDLFASWLPEDVDLSGSQGAAESSFIGPEYNEQATQVEEAIARVARQAEILRQEFSGVYHAEDRLAFADQAAAAFGEGTSTYTDAVTRYGEALDSLKFQEMAAEAAEAKGRVRDLDAALTEEMDIIGRLSESHDRAAQIVEYEKAVRQAYADDIERQIELIERYKDKLEELRNAEFVNQQLQSLGDTLADIAMDFENAADAATSFFRSLAQQAISQYVTQPLVSNIAAWFSALGSASAGTATGAADITSGIPGTAYAHAGGVMGVDALPRRAVDAGVFAGARRYHTGLMPGEVPAILKRKEGVFTEGQMAALGRGLSVPATGGWQGPKNLNVRLVNESSAPVQADSAQWDVDINDAVVSITLRDYDTGGRTRTAFRR